MSGSLMLLISVWLLCLLVAARVLRRFSLALATRGTEPLSGAFAAERRAQLMLREMLTDAQYEQVMHDGYLEVRSPSRPSRTYRIPCSAGRVSMFERGREIAELCVQPTEPLPDSDLVILHKLMIEGNEREYLSKANHFVPGTLGTVIRRR